MAVSAPGPQLLRQHGGADVARVRVADRDHPLHLITKNQSRAGIQRYDIDRMATATIPVTLRSAAGFGTTTSSKRRRARTRRTAVRAAQLQSLGLR
eukprot:12118611-Alexandrium_andersonii.AAC.1